MARLAAIIIGFILGFFIIVPWAEGHHTGVPCGPDSHPGRFVCLPYADSSFAVKTLQQTNRLTYCFNQRAASYPNFINQVREVNAQQENAWGFDWVEISGVYATSSQANAAGCQVWHSMPETHGCPNCGAWVHYLNKPVIIEYRWQAGYVFWQTTIAHEQTHILGLHEHYDDANFLGYRATYGRWAHGYEYGTDPGTATDSPTVMDFSTGVFAPTRYDVRYVCENIDPLGNIFVGCGAQQPSCSEFPCYISPRWIFGDEEGSTAYRPDKPQVVLSDGFLHAVAWERLINGEWVPEYGNCTSWGGRENLLLTDRLSSSVFMPQNTAIYVHSEGWWSIVPSC